MIDSRRDSSQVASSWNTYWHGTGDVGAYSSGGVSHPAILTFWDEYFQTVQQEFDALKIIDIASGNGAVVERALTVFADVQPEFTCVDVSAAAIANIRQRFPQVSGVVADARSIPLDSGSFDVATSQFGVEYAGLDAIDEATDEIGAREGIRVQGHDEGCMGRLQGDVHASSEPRIGVEGYELDEGIALTHHGDRPVRRAVVDHDRLDLEASVVLPRKYLPLDRLETAFQHMKRVPGHDHDGEIRHASAPADEDPAAAPCKGGSAAPITCSGSMRVMQR